MGCWRVPLKCQKFLHPSPQKFRQHLRKLDFFSKKNTIFADFEGQFFLWWGCAWSEIFFWGDRHRLGVKPHGRPKSRTGPPQPSVSRFWFPRIEKSHFFIFLMKISHFSGFFIGSQEGPQMPEISSSNRSSKIDLSEGRTKKSATFDPQNPRFPNPAL